MNARLLGALLAGITLAATGSYVFVYLYRWEWNRALMSAALFIATEIAVVGALTARRLREVERRLDDDVRGERVRVVHHLRDTAPPPRIRFDWLARPEQLSVFVPVLLGAGFVLSALAWLVERLARATARPVAENRLAAQLDGLGLPAHGFLDSGRDQLDLLRGPVGGVAR
ncbi:MAG: hypothetical protein ACRD29_07175 [Acidimicrobiales bacterium]